MHRLTRRETVQVIAALRYWGRSQEVEGQPERHWAVGCRFTQAGVLPMTLDELETLIGRMDGSLETGHRPWNPRKFL